MSFPGDLGRLLWNALVCFFLVIGTLALAALMCVGTIVYRLLPWSDGHVEAVLPTLSHTATDKVSIGPAAGHTATNGISTVVAIIVLAVLVVVCLCEALPPRPGTWTGVDPEPIAGAELEALRATVRAASLRQKQKYHFGVEVKAAFRVARGGAVEARFKAKRATLRQRRKPDDDCQLYHGTSPESARAIITDGFRLPPRKGMFGRGVYFADCPLKSLQYTRRGVMLACDVVLGYSKRTYLPHNELSPTKDLKRGLFPRLFGARSFDSVTADSGWAGCVRVPEMVVYDPAQAVPRYVMLVQKTSRPAQ